MEQGKFNTSKTETHAQKIDACRRELSSLKTELQRTKGQFKRSVIREEIRSVSRKLIRLEEGF